MGKAITEIGTYAGPISATTKIPVSDGDTLQAATAAQLVDYNTAATHAATSKATPVDADELPLVDSAASWALKKLTWANLKATLKTYLDTLYQATLVSGTNIKTINSTSLLGSGDLAISATPGGSTTQVQFNDGGAFAGDAGLTYAKATDTLTAGAFKGTTTGAESGTLSHVIPSENSGIGRNSSVGGLVIFAGAAQVTINNGDWHFRNNVVFSWDSVASTHGTKVTGISQNAAGVVEVNSGTAGTYRDLKLRNLIGTGNLTTGILPAPFNYTATANDGSIEVDATFGAVTITLPAVSGCAGRIYTIKKTDASGNAVTVDPNASETIDGATTVSLASQYSTITIQANAAGTAWHKLSGI